ncbi:6-phosphogluconate dehydrogenase [Stagonosporopsis vannaccii]|nr:6-phosphogluconate dehydrogenase [Stagonosporopsis vannaccii]
MTLPHATVAVLSIGQMGLGIATLLLAHDFRVITNVSDRSVATQERARSAGIEQLDSDINLVAQADYVLSIVPPKDAPATAHRIIAALKHQDVRRNKKEPLWFLDLNAGSPDSATERYSLFAREVPTVKFIDGGIIGGPPRAKEDSIWSRPGIPLSGPHSLASAPIAGTLLAETLNSRPLGARIGSASGLKACFAALSKGFTALAIQSYTTASALDVLPDLRFYLDQYNPTARQRAEKGIPECTGKAYRWIEEMHQIGQTFAEQGGFGESARVFREIAGVYQGLADLVEKGEGGRLGEADGVAGELGKHLKASGSISGNVS